MDQQLLNLLPLGLFLALIAGMVVWVARRNKSYSDHVNTVTKLAEESLETQRLMLAEIRDIKTAMKDESQ